MKITTIKVSAGITIPHPNQSYANLKFFLEMTAELKAAEDHIATTMQLQTTVNQLLNEERDNRLAIIQRQHEKERLEREEQYKKQQSIRAAEEAVREAEMRLANIREGREPDDDGIPF